MTKAQRIALEIRKMTYDELISLANDFVGMQTTAREDGWEWKPGEVYGEFGLTNMLWSWAEGQEEE